VDGTTLSLHRNHNAPPWRCEIFHTPDVALAHYGGRSVKNGVVRLDLSGQSVQGIVVTLYLVADEMAVNNRNIGPEFPVLQAQFIDYKRIGSRMVSAQLLAVETRTYLGIVHGTVPGRLLKMYDTLGLRSVPKLTTRGRLKSGQNCLFARPAFFFLS